MPFTTQPRSGNIATLHLQSQSSPLAAQPAASEVSHRPERDLEILQWMGNLTPTRANLELAESLTAFVARYGTELPPNATGPVEPATAANASALVLNMDALALNTGAPVRVTFTSPTVLTAPALPIAAPVIAPLAPAVTPAIAGPIAGSLGPIARPAARPCDPTMTTALSTFDTHINAWMRKAAELGLPVTGENLSLGFSESVSTAIMQIVSEKSASTSKLAAAKVVIGRALERIEMFDEEATRATLFAALARACKDAVQPMLERWRPTGDDALGIRGAAYSAFCRQVGALVEAGARAAIEGRVNLGSQAATASAPSNRAATASASASASVSRSATAPTGVAAALSPPNSSHPPHYFALAFRTRLQGVAAGQAAQAFDNALGQTFTEIGQLRSSRSERIAFVSELVTAIEKFLKAEERTPLADALWSLAGTNYEGLRPNVAQIQSTNVESMAARDATLRIIDTGIVRGDAARHRILQRQALLARTSA